MQILFAAVVSLLFGACCFAQTATLRGQVRDQSGASVPAAKVVITGANGVSVAAVADGTGVYSATLPAAGEYGVEASAANLAQAQPVKIRLKTGGQTLDLQLTIVRRVEQVTVRESAEGTVSTAAAENASALVLRGADLDALPDDPDDLQTDLQALAGPSAGPNGGSIYIDGFSNGEIPPKSSIREIRINQNPFSPEYDKLGYGRVDIFTKPGSDKYRATVNYNLGTQAWNSRNPYSAQKPPFLLNEFEGDGGGPLGKRASFVMDAQRNAVDNGSVTNAVVVNAQTLAVTPFSGTITTPQRLFRISPRVDYELNPNNTLTMRYGVTEADIRDAGIGAFDLISRGYHTRYTNQTVQVSETAIIGTTVNELRFQYYRMAMHLTANNDVPQIVVLGAFNGGGSRSGHSSDTQDSFELQNYTSSVHGAHSLKFGARLRELRDDNVWPFNFNGTFTFAGDAQISSIERYRRTLLYRQLGYSPDAVRAMGGGATQFTLSAGQPEVAMHQFDAGLFVGDEWRLKPNFTVNLGLRYETQTHLHDWRDFAPRAAIAWALGSRRRTVLRAGFGMFYERFALINTLSAERYNGVVQRQYVVNNPDFFPNVPSTAALAGYAAAAQVTQKVSSQLRAPYIMQSAITLERQLPANTTLAVTYSNSHGLHQLRSRDINAPLPGSGAFPLGSGGPLFLAESAGLYNQNQLIVNTNAKLNGGVSLFGFYVFNKALSNTDGIGTFPANSYSDAGEYGAAATDVRNRVTFGGSITTRWNIRFSPFLVLQSGSPFNVTSGNDLYGTTLFNARPGIAKDANKPGLVETAYGLLDPNPVAGEALLPRNFGRGPGQVNFNVRLSKTIGFGPERGGAKKASGPSGGPGLNPVGLAAGRGLGSIIGVPSSGRRYNLTVSLSARNLLNHVNPGPITGNITSPLFGQANQVAGAPNGEGFFETANNRRLELQLRFAF